MPKKTRKRSGASAPDERLAKIKMDPSIWGADFEDEPAPPAKPITSERPTHPGFPPFDARQPDTVIPPGGADAVEELSLLQDTVTALCETFGPKHPLYDPLGTFADALTKFRRRLPHLTDTELRDAYAALELAVSTLFAEYNDYLESVPVERNQDFAKIFTGQATIKAQLGVR